jgi:hypothetical protein
MAKNTYKVWIDIEKLDAKGNTVKQEAVLPDSLGTFNDLKKAVRRVASIVRQYCPDPEHSDCVKWADQMNAAVAAKSKKKVKKSRKIA